MKRFITTLLVAIFVFSSTAPTVLAISDDQHRLFSAGIGLLDVDPTKSFCTTGAGLSGTNNRSKVFNYFIQHGLETHQAAGIFGNLAVESGHNISPFAEEKVGQDSGGKGIAQWTNTRRISFENAAHDAQIITRQADYKALPDDKKAGAEEAALQFNLDYLWNEATQRGDLDKLRQEGTNVPNSVGSWQRWFERAGKPNLGNRLKEANDAMAEFGGSTSAASTAATAPAVSDNGTLIASNGCGSAGVPSGVVGIALKEVGKLETDPDCNKYFGSSKQTCVGTPWCAAFVRWVYNEAGMTVGGGDRAKGVGKWFADNKFFFKWQEHYRPQLGDVFVKGRSGSGTGWAGDGHTGIVVEINDFSITTVEGNSGNKVKKNSYPDYRKIPELIGFGRYVDKGSVQPDPNFDPVTGAGGTYAANNEQ